MDALSILLDKVAEGGYIFGYKFMGTIGSEELIAISLLMILSSFIRILKTS